MILKNLTLKNFRKFKDATIEFPDGVTGVVGLNGAGKSTIFEAIAWVLYGSVAARTSYLARSNSRRIKARLSSLSSMTNMRVGNIHSPIHQICVF